MVFPIDDSSIFVEDGLGDLECNVPVDFEVRVGVLLAGVDNADGQGIETSVEVVVVDYCFDCLDSFGVDSRVVRCGGRLKGCYKRFRPVAANKDTSIERQQG